MTRVKGFTLIELLIVIGILAILATTVVLVLNPAQLLAETRDTQRISDLDTMRTAINLFLTTVTGPGQPDLDGSAVNAGTCGATWWTSNAGGIAVANKPFTTGGAGASQAYSTIANEYGNAPRAINGAGWLPVNFGAIPGGSPLASLPVDPNSDTTPALDAAAGAGGRYYAYQCENSVKTYEINANMESIKHNSRPDASVTTSPEQTDGGNKPHVYEVGNDPDLNL